MHELSIAKSIVDSVLASVAERPSAAIASVHLRIGELTDIAADALEFGFSVLSRGTRLEHTTLRIESVPIVARCNACRQSFTVEDYHFVCPACKSGDLHMLHGDELEIDHVILNEPDHPDTNHPRK